MNNEKRFKISGGTEVERTLTSMYLIEHGKSRSAAFEDAGEIFVYLQGTDEDYKEIEYINSIAKEYHSTLKVEEYARSWQSW